MQYSYTMQANICPAHLLHAELFIFVQIIMYLPRYRGKKNTESNYSREAIKRKHNSFFYA
jgi:hypothetical protein